MLLRILLSVSLALAPLQAPVSQPPKKPEPYLDTDAYAVYSALLPQEWTWRDAHAKRLVIVQETAGSFFGERFQDLCIKGDEEFQKEYGSLLENFIQANQSARMLVRGFLIDKPYELVPRARIDAYFGKQGPAGWKAFYADYPDSKGFIWVSAVGFNKDKTLALVLMSHSCGGLCGGGTYHFLEKKDGKWTRAQLKGKPGSCAWAS
jgi:hypothetical protein